MPADQSGNFFYFIFLFQFFVVDCDWRMLDQHPLAICTLLGRKQGLPTLAKKGLMASRLRGRDVSSSRSLAWRGQL